MTIIDTSSAPTVPARKVEALKPDLLLTQEHHMCPGCGEPLAVRQFLETIEAVREAALDGTSFGASTEREVELAAEIVDALPLNATGKVLKGALRKRLSA